MKTKRNKIFKVIASMLIITVLLIMPCSASAFNSESSNDDSIIMESGENNFTINVVFDNIEKPFASAQFDITVSDGKEVNAVDISFDNGISKKASGTVNTISSGGRADGNQIVYKAGFLSTENQFNGKLNVGTISFNYTGNTPQTITLNNLEVHRFTGNYNEGLPELEKTEESWSKTITVSRETTEQKVADPKASPLPGKYKSNTEIVLTCMTDGAKIYYTVDGSNPTESSMLYSKPIILNKDMNIKAFAVKEGYIDSSIMTFSYTVSSGSSGSGTGSGSGSGSGTVEQPTIPTEEPVLDTMFDDVKKGDWFYDAVQYVNKNGLMKGTSVEPMLFSPHGTTTRGMVVTIFYRMAGSPSVTTNNPFNDVDTGQYYTDAVIWASQNNIVSGYGSGKFGPNNSITREQMAVILMNYAKLKGYDVSARSNLSGFDDFSSVSQWALDAISWANAKGLIQGSDNNLMPNGNAERCQVAAILHRFIEMYKN